MSAESYREWDIPAAEWWWWKVSESAREQFAENLRKSQAAQKAAQIQEQKFKWYDNTLAAIVQWFLQAWGFDKIIILIADLVEHNVPSDFILAILSIISEDALKQVNLRLQDWKFRSFDLTLTFSDNLKSKIYSWVSLIYSSALVDKERILSSLINSDTWECLPSAHLIFHEILIKFLEDNSFEYDREEQRLFSKNLFINMMDKIQNELY